MYGLAHGPLAYLHAAGTAARDEGQDDEESCSEPRGRSRSVLRGRRVRRLITIGGVECLRILFLGRPNHADNPTAKNTRVTLTLLQLMSSELVLFDPKNEVEMS